MQDFCLVFYSDGEGSDHHFRPIAVTQTRKGKDRSLEDSVILRRRGRAEVRKGSLGAATRSQVLDQRHRQ